ncbi:hypothetical protein DFO55_102543 [Grimontella sp. AG753]|nr:hypothetical protein DFO55_102543 [Grimontella sp. AG753]
MSKSQPILGEIKKALSFLNKLFVWKKEARQGGIINLIEGLF